MVYWIWQWFRSEILAVPGRLASFGFIVFLLLAPFILRSPFVLYLSTFCMIYAIYAASWDILAGCTGQVNLGQSLYFGIAAYTCALLNINWDLPAWITIPCGAFVASAAGILTGLPGLRLRGIYLSLVTLAFPVITIGIIMTFPTFTGGELGLSGVARLCSSRIGQYYVVLGVLLACVFGMLKIVDAKSKWIRIGVILHAIREDEITARTSGINTSFYKLMAFGISGFFGGIAGGLYVHIIRSAGPSTMDLFFSFQALLWTIFGSMGTIYGAVVGVFILYPTVELACLHPFGEEVRFIGNAVLMICVLLFMPEGVSTWVRDKLELYCPRCKERNFVSRTDCRICGAALK